MAKLIDANVILRYLLKDHPQMSESARQTIAEGAFTLPEILAEVVYVLKGGYEVERKEIAQVLIDFLEEISLENKELYREALTIFAETSLDFVDCILIARQIILGDEIVTFDKKLNNALDRRKE
ncbi:MAG: PIN domain-containing protein [Lachnospiraceae bacterium]|nr:PIN domain-containing protein [Lachnospiraceae bacterium]